MVERVFAARVPGRPPSMTSRRISGPERSRADGGDRAAKRRAVTRGIHPSWVTARLAAARPREVLANLTDRTVSTLGAAQCSGGEVTRNSRQESGRSAWIEQDSCSRNGQAMRRRK